MSKRERSRTYKKHKNSKSGMEGTLGKSGKCVSVAESIRDVAATAADYGISAYLILLIGVLPFYFTQGYGYIATDKATFFSKVSVNLGKVLIPVLVVYLIAAIAVYYANRMVKKGEKKSFPRWNWKNCRISVTDICVALYGLSVVVAYFCSDYREDALWGARGWYMGLISQLILVSIYFLTSRLWRPKKWIFYLLLPVSMVVFALGYLNRFGIYPFEMEWSNPSYISTIGNINWYCGYSVIVFFAGVGLFWRSCVAKLWQIPLWMLYLCVGFGSLTVQGSVSGVVTIVGMLILLFCLSAGDRNRMQRFWAVALCFSISCLVTMLLRERMPEAITYTDNAMDLLTIGKLPIAMTLVSIFGVMITYFVCRICKPKGESRLQPEKVYSVMAVTLMTLVSCAAVVLIVNIVKNTLNPGSIGVWSQQQLFTFSASWGSNRGATWKAGILCFQEQDLLHKLVGVGPDAMSAYIYNDGSEELLAMMRERFGNQMLTNAHNEWLTVLVNYGLLGLAAFVGMFMSAVWSFLRQMKAGYCAVKISDKTSEEESAKKEKCINTENRINTEEWIAGMNLPAASALGIFAYTINNMFSFGQTMNMTLLFILLGVGSAFLKKKEGTLMVKRSVGRGTVTDNFEFLYKELIKGG